jgi:hypothetical protein
LTGATQEDVRRAAEHRGRLKRATRTYLEGRQYLLNSKPGQIMELKREAAQAAERELRKALPPAEAPQKVALVRPELHEAIKKMGPPAVRKARGRGGFDDLANAARQPVESASTAPRESIADVFARLGREAEPPVPSEPAFDWAAYADRQDDTGTDARESGFATLARRGRMSEAG